jgi:selenocysteine-specific elongation factor
MQQIVGVTGPSNHGKTSLLRKILGAKGFELLSDEAMYATTEVGYSELKLPSSGSITIVDLPGNERFQTNMIAGAMIMDVALFVIAADEADELDIREQIRILEFLPVKQLIIAISRVDAAEKDHLSVIQSLIIDAIYTTRFLNAKMVFVSAITGEGIDELLCTLDEELLKFKEGSGRGRDFYFPVDKVIVQSGREAMLMGVVADGTIHVGDDAQIVPNMDLCKVKGIIHLNQTVSQAERGQRVAITITGTNLQHVGRGTNVASPNSMIETSLLDVKLEWAMSVQHRSEVHLSIGTNDVTGQIFLNQQDHSKAQLRLAHAVGAKTNQPILLRLNNPKKLIGSGFVLQPDGETRIKRDAIIDNLEVAAFRIIERSLDGVYTNDICTELRKSQQELGNPLESLLAQQRVVSFAGLWMTPQVFLAEAQKFLKALQELHQESPSQLYQPRELVLERMGSKWNAKPLDRIVTKLAELGKLELSGNNIRLKGFKILLSGKQEAFLDRVEEELNHFGIECPYPSDIARILGVPVRAVEEILMLGANSGRLVQTSETIFYTEFQIDQLKILLRESVGRKPFTITEARDTFNTSRRFLIPLLEHFDRIGFTKRVDEERQIIE